MKHARIENGTPEIITGREFRLGDDLHSVSCLGIWSKEFKLARGIYEVVEEVPEGQRATAWTYAVDGDVVRGTPTLEPIPPQPVSPTLEQIASLLATHATDGDGLVVGRYYEAGNTVVVEGTTYDIIQSFLYADANWQPQHLMAHLTARAVGNAWAPGIAVSVGEVYTYDGASYAVLQAHTTQAGWEPPNVPALWEVVP